MIGMKTPTSHAPAIAGVPSGSTARSTSATAKITSRAAAAASTGPIAIRMSGLADDIRVARRAVAATNSAIVMTSRTGRTHDSTKAGSEAVSWNALAGQSDTHDAHWDGVG